RSYGDWSSDVCSSDLNLRDEDVDGLCDRARQGGVTIGEEPNDKFWGDRTFQVVHPDGYRITFAKHVRDVSEQEMHEAMKQWAPRSEERRVGKEGRARG